MVEHFNPTQRTWINEQLDLGDRGLFEVRTHIAQTYHTPLELYFSATSWARERRHDPDWSPDTVVHEFLADRLSRDDYLRKWIESGLRMRRWLINGLHLYLNEHYRKTRRIGGGDEALDAVPVQAEPGLDADRVMVCGMVRQSIKQVVTGFESAGQDAHAKAFVMAYLEQAGVSTIAEALDMTAGQIKGMLRLARTRFKAAFLELLERDGIPPGRLEEEIQAIMEVVNA